MTPIHRTPRRRTCTHSMHAQSIRGMNVRDDPMVSSKNRLMCATILAGFLVSADASFQEFRFGMMNAKKIQHLLRRNMPARPQDSYGYIDSRRLPFPYRKYQRYLSLRKPKLFVTQQDPLVETTKLRAVDETAKEQIANSSKSCEEDSSSRNAVLDAFMCVVNLDDVTVPFISRMDSESTWIEFTEDGLVVPDNGIGQIKEELANILAEPTIEITVCGAVLMSSLLVALSTLPFLSDIAQHQIFVLQNAVGIIFVLEFAGRWFSSSAEASKHVLNPQFAVDVFVVILPLLFDLTPANFWTVNMPWIPSWLISPSALINLELLRVLKLQRVLRDRESFAKFESALGIRRSKDSVKDWQLQLARVVLSLVTLLSVATGLIYTVEHDVNPAITDYFTALYFGLITLTTVGFGDITPVTWGGKLVVCGSILAGVALIPPQAALLVKALLSRQESLQQQSNRFAFEKHRDSSHSPNGSNMLLDTTSSCTYCGAAFHWASAKYCYSCGKELGL